MECTFFRRHAAQARCDCALFKFLPSRSTKNVNSIVVLKALDEHSCRSVGVWGKNVRRRWLSRIGNSAIPIGKTTDPNCPWLLYSFTAQLRVFLTPICFFKDLTQIPEKLTITTKWDRVLSQVLRKFTLSMVCCRPLMGP